MRTRSVRGVEVPSFFYGTAWKEERTAELARLALDAGFSAIDTANQRRHYVESAVGEAVARFIADGRGRREDLFLQTKFTYARGQDHRIPYDPGAAPAVQVAQSFESSLEHLQTSYVDAYVLHGPSRAHGLSAVDWEVWRAMETLQRSGRVRLLGVSNVALEQLAALCREAEIAPAFVQNRCFASDAWDGELRAFCRSHDIVYQGFSLLTANGRELSRPAIRQLAEQHGRSVAQLVFRFAVQVGMIPLTGTSDARHMREDLEVFDFELTAQETYTLESVGLR